MSDVNQPKPRRSGGSATLIVLLVVAAALAYAWWSFNRGVEAVGVALEEGAKQARQLAKETAAEVAAVLEGGYKTQPRFQKALNELVVHRKVIAALGEPIVEQGLYNYTSAVDGAFAKYTFGIHLSGPKGKGKGDVAMVQGENGVAVVDKASFTGADGVTLDLMVAD